MTEFAAYIAVETDAAVLTALAQVHRRALERSTARTTALRDELARAESAERESAERLRALATRREQLHAEAMAPDAAALAAANALDHDLGSTQPGYGNPYGVPDTGTTVAVGIDADNDPDATQPRDPESDA